MKIIFADGGCSGNGGLDAKAFGSYRVGEAGELVYKEYGPLTNNEAEYRIIIDALREAGDATTTLKTDSMLVVQQTLGLWKIRAERLRALCSELRNVLDSTGAKLQWISRDEIVRVLGH